MTDPKPDFEELWEKARVALNTTARDKKFHEWRLSPREGEVAALAIKGITYRTMAKMLGMSEKTLKQHLSSVYEKAGASNRAELGAFIFPTR